MVLTFTGEPPLCKCEKIHQICKRVSNNIDEFHDSARTVRQIDSATKKNYAKQRRRFPEIERGKCAQISM